MPSSPAPAPAPVPTLDGESGVSAETVPTVTITQKRQRELEEGLESAKRYKTIMGSVAEEYVCPITTELPVDPVTADDGGVYERSAIVECIERQGDDLKSPATNLPMGPKLLPALQVRNSIRKLIDSGAIEGDLANRWNERIEEEAEVADTKKKAEQGDPDAMCNLGEWYFYGLKGLSEDEKQAYEWYKKPSDLQSARGMAEEGRMLIFGWGVEQNICYGIAQIAMAAASGSDVGAFYMGYWHLKGWREMPKDVTKAKYWLRKVAHGTCSVKHLWEADYKFAKKRLEKLEKEEEE